MSLIENAFDALKEYLSLDRTAPRFDFTFTELSGSTKVIDGMAAGRFTDMLGREISFKAEDLAAYVENTNALIESTRAETGELVGLPIDMDGHDRSGGAGWIVGAELDEERSIIRFSVNWTDQGESVVRANTRRFFSPTVDPKTKTVLGGSLTNWPATRDAKQHLLLRPIALSQQIKEIDMEKTLEGLIKLVEQQGKEIAKLSEAPPVEAPEEEPEEIPEVPSEELAKLLSSPEGVAELAKHTDLSVKQAVKLMERREHAVRFATDLTVGTADAPYGAPIHASEIVTLLLSLPAKQASVVEDMMRRMWKNVIDFAEHGLDVTNLIRGNPLPEEYARLARSWVADGKDIAEFMKINADILGDARDYNLAEFKLEKKEN